MEYSITACFSCSTCIKHQDGSGQAHAALAQNNLCSLQTVAALLYSTLLCPVSFCILLCPALPCLHLPCLALSPTCPALPCLHLPCLALPCPHLPCPVPTCPALPCPVLTCPVLLVPRPGPKCPACYTSVGLPNSSLLGHNSSTHPAFICLHGFQQCMGSNVTLPAG